MLSSCRKDSDTTPPQFFRSYYPTEVGSYVVYEVDSMSHDITSDTFHFQLREVIAEQFTDGAGDPALRIERFVRDSSQAPWVLRDVWTAKVTNTVAERVEENRRFTKMIFPVEVGETWDGNLSNTLPAEDYEYLEAHSSGQIGNLIFDSLTTIEQARQENLVDSIFKFEIYANHVGLVQRTFRELDFGDVSGDIKGVEFYQTAIEYGQ